MKTFKRLVLEILHPLVVLPRQSAYKAQIAVHDTIVYLVHCTYSHLDKSGGSMKIMFFYFSTSFNIIQPVLLVGGSSPTRMDQGLSVEMSSGWCVWEVAEHTT